ncbi:phage tail protein [Fibrisoma montanum]|nr:tail fiber protein [Fibrisoma montanum]
MEPFIGQVQLFAFDFAPKGWMLCNGQLLSIAQNSALYSLLGVKYGGDGINTFALPDLRGRVAIGQGQGPGLNLRIIGDESGTEHVTLLITQMPQHNHLMMVSDQPATESSPQGHLPAVAAIATPGGATVNAYGTFMDAYFNPQAISPAGGSQSHENMQPYLTLNYCIATEGIYPSHP